MADSKLTGLPELISGAASDLVYVVRDPGGASPLSRKITLANLILSASPTVGLSSLNILNSPTLGGPTYLVAGTNTGLSQSNASITFNINAASGALSSLNVPNNAPINSAAYLEAGTNVSLSQSNASIIFNVNAPSGNVLALTTQTPASVASSGLAGTGTSAARLDHVHQGVLSVNASGNGPLYGATYLDGGANVSLSQTNSSIVIAVGSGLNFVSNILNIQVFS